MNTQLTLHSTDYDKEQIINLFSVEVAEYFKQLPSENEIETIEDILKRCCQKLNAKTC